MRPLEGRRLWFVGIGGAGMSALAAVTKAWGAEVAGSDRVRSSYVEFLEQQGIPITIGHARDNVPPAWEVIASTAIPADNPELRPGMRRRGELLAELVELRPSIVVAGTHGKTTTAAMIAFVLDQLGLDPAFLIGGSVPQLGGNGRAGEGWLVAEGDESDRSLELLRPRIAVVTNTELDHHVTFASRAEVENLYQEWTRGLLDEAVVILGHELSQDDGLELELPGAHNRANAACAREALEASGVSRETALEVLGRFRGVGRRLEERGQVKGVHLFDDYAHHPTEVRATLDAARTLAGGGRILVLFQPHLYSRTRYLARDLAASLVAADAVFVTDVYPAREDPVPGVTGKVIVDYVSELRPGMTVGWAPSVAEAADLAAAETRSGDLVLTMGAGDVDEAIPRLLERLAS